MTVFVGYARITCLYHFAYALAEHHMPPGFNLGLDSVCPDCRDLLLTLNGTARAFSHISRQQRALLNAVHEAGHAVAHLVFGHTVNWAMVEPDPDVLGVIGNVNFDCDSTADKLAVSTWAGSEAALHQLDRWGVLDDESRLDVACGMRGDWALLEGLALVPSLIEECRLDAADLVARHWPAIERVADALLASGRLFGEEIAAIAQLPCNA